MLYPIYVVWFTYTSLTRTRLPSDAGSNVGVAMLRLNKIDAADGVDLRVTSGGEGGQQYRLVPFYPWWWKHEGGV